MIFARRLVGTHEIAAMLGVSRQRAQQITSRKDFPKPYDVLHMGKVWKRATVEAWARDHGRPAGDSLVTGLDGPPPGGDAAGNRLATGG